MDAIRVLVGSTVATLLLGLGILEVASQRVRIDPPSTAADLAEVPSPSRQSSLSAPGDLLDVDLGPTTGRDTETVRFVEAEER